MVCNRIYSVARVGKRGMFLGWGLWDIFYDCLLLRCIWFVIEYILLQGLEKGGCFWVGGYVIYSMTV